MDIRRFGFSRFTSSPTDGSPSAKKSFFNLSRNEQLEAARPAVVTTLGIGTPVVSAAAAVVLGLSAVGTLGVLAGGVVAGALAAGIAHLAMGGDATILR